MLGKLELNCFNDIIYSFKVYYFKKKIETMITVVLFAAIKFMPPSVWCMIFHLSAFIV